MNFESYKFKLESNLSETDKILFNIRLCVYPLFNSTVNFNLVSVVGVDNKIILDYHEFCYQFVGPGLDRLQIAVKNFYSSYHSYHNVIDLENYISTLKVKLLNNIEKIKKLRCYIDNEKVSSLEYCCKVLNLLNQINYTCNLYKNYIETDLQVLDEAYKYINKKD